MTMAQHLLSRWAGIASRIGEREIALFLDYDGTLTPIVKTPGRARLTSYSKKQLSALAGEAGVVAIVSGRKLADIKEKVCLSGIDYVGNHGLEIEYAGRKLKGIIPRGFLAIIKKIKELLQKKLHHVEGLLLEDKGVILAVHYRQVKRNDLAKVKKKFYETMKAYGKSQVKIGVGKKVLEIRPPVDWDKGKAVFWLLQSYRKRHGANYRSVFPIYIGDDKTDEDAFAALKGVGLTVAVGQKRNTQAEYYVKNSEEVYKFLKNVYAFLKERKICKQSN